MIRTATSVPAASAIAALLLAACGPENVTPTADSATRPATPQGSHGASPGSAATPAGSYPSAPPGSAAPSATPAASGSASAPKVDDAAWSTATETTLDTSAGKIVVHAVHHGTVYVEVDHKVIWIDPFSEGKLDDKPKADFVLITDIHADHLDEKALAVVKTRETKVMGPKSVADKLDGSATVAKADFEVIANGEKKKLGPVEVEAIPMYNTQRGPEPGKLFHDKGRGNGYVLAYGGKRIYLSGDTECTPEMKALTQIDLAFVCMNLPYTMPPVEAAACVAAFQPKSVIPYHHRGSDLAAFEKKLEGSAVRVEKLKFY